MPSSSSSRNRSHSPPDAMTRVYVSRLNPKTTKQELERVCSRFGSVTDCIIFPQNEKHIKRSGFVTFTTSQAAREMARQAREQTIYINDTSIEVELRRGSAQHHNVPVFFSLKNRSRSRSRSIYTLSIDGPIVDEDELTNYFGTRPLFTKWIESIDSTGKTTTIGAHITLDNVDLVERILKQNHDKYTIKLLSETGENKRVHDLDSTESKRSKVSDRQSPPLLAFHLHGITTITNEFYQENERLKSENEQINETINEYATKIEQLEQEKSELVESLSKTHDVAKRLTTTFKTREDEHKKILDDSQRKILELESMVKTANNALLVAKSEINRLTHRTSSLELQIQEVANKCTESETIQLTQQHNLELFFTALKKIQK